MWEGLLGGIEEVPGEDGAVNGSGRLPAAPWRRCSLGTRRAGEGPLAKKRVEGGKDGDWRRGDPGVRAPLEGTDLRGEVFRLKGHLLNGGTSGRWGVRPRGINVGLVREIACRGGHPGGRWGTGGEGSCWGAGDKLGEHLLREGTAG